MKRQIIFSFASQALLGFAGLVFVSAFVSAYGKEQYALFSIFLAVASSVQNLDGLQMPLVAKLSQLTSNREKIAQMMQSATLFSTVIGCTGAIIAAVALSIALPDYFLQWRLWLVFIGVGIFIINHFSLSAHRAYLITKERSSVIHISKAFSYIALFVCAFTIMSVRREVYLASAAFPIAAIINSIILNKSIGLQISANKDFSEAFKRHRKDFINGLWFNASVFLFMIIDKIFIGQEGAMKAADYMIPYELFQRLALVHTVIGTVLLGKIATSINREKNNKAISEYSMLYLNTIFFVLIIYMNMIMYGQDFLEIWLKDAVNPTLINNYYLLSTAFF